MASGPPGAHPERGGVAPGPELRDPENLQSLTEWVLERIQAFQSLAQGRLRGCAEPPADVLSTVVELVQEACSLLFWLNRTVRRLRRRARS